MSVAGVEEETAIWHVVVVPLCYYTSIVVFERLRSGLLHIPTQYVKTTFILN